MRLIAIALLCALLFACKKAPSPPKPPKPHKVSEATAADLRLPREDFRTSPLSAELRGPSSPRAYSALRLQLELDRRIPVHADVTIDVRLPKGVTLAGGPPQRALARNLRAQRDALVFDLTVSAIPREDLVVVIDARGQGFGYHAELPYRFGRPEPVPVGPRADGRELRVAGKSFGRSVPVRTR
jgi:hypothetical protein